MASQMSLWVRQNIDEAPSENKDLKTGISFQTFLASLLAAVGIFGAEFLIFYLFKAKFKRIYAPRTYLVPERERTTTSNGGFVRWVVPVFKTSNSEFIQKCGLDAYLFLRYLRMLCKIFLPIACVVLPTLLPLNRTAGDNTSGMDQFAWQNINAESSNRLWAHLVLAVFVVVWVFYVFYDELRKFVRLRQAYLTSPQHRLRASATTVLVQAIPRKWLSLKALDELYDVFPGGVRNIWLNRNFDDLAEKVQERDRLTKKLEAAETTLIKNAAKAHMKQAKKDGKTEAVTVPEKGHGISAGDPHQIPHDWDDHSRKSSPHAKHRIPIVGGGLEKVGHGLQAAGHGIKDAVGGAIGKTRHTLDERVEAANAGYGFQPDAEAVKQDNRGSRDILHHDSNDLAPLTKPSTDGARDERLSGAAPDSATGEKKKRNPRWKLFQRDSSHMDFPTPRPASVEEDEFPLKQMNTAGDAKRGSKTYPQAYDEEFLEDDESAVWRKYVTDKDRETMRLPILKYNWWPSLPFIGKEVDTIYYCRKELARLNSEIDIDQQEPEKFPLMNSAFIQFNNQVAAHMACQAVSHHIPKHMAPRTIEISPDDVLWDNLSIKWWERYIRKTVIIIIVSGTVVFWAIPVSFTGALSQIHTLAQDNAWLGWLEDLPTEVQAAISGVAPPALLAALLAVLPFFLRFMATLAGYPTGVTRELSVQAFFFAFLFVQVFLVVSLSSGILTTISKLASNPVGVTQALANNMPKASNYFFSYMILQALTVSAGALVQVAGLFLFFIWGPIMDWTARQKFNRQRKLNKVKWGTFFPIYTNLACIGLIYCIISPLIIVFCLITFSLFWIVYRYQTLYVHGNNVDTGGLLFPTAINQLFTGLYVMEVCLAALFFIQKNEVGDFACTAQGIIMIIVFVLTILYHFLLNDAFAPLYRYIPITMEDDAVRRDEEFARAQDKRFGLLGEDDTTDNIQDVLKGRERDERREEKAAEEIEMRDIEANRREGHDGDDARQGSAPHLSPRSTSWKDRRTSSYHLKDGAATDNAEAGRALSRSRTRTRLSQSRQHTPSQPARGTSADTAGSATSLDVESQRGTGQHAATDFLFAGFHDEIEDLSPDERDKLVRRAFQHEAVRANRPSVWIPRDPFGISTDEIRRTHRFAGGHIWISNEYTKLDKKNRVLYSRPPPDFDARELMRL